MEFRILGPLEARDGLGAVVPVRGARERALLLTLLLHANEVVPAAHLSRDLWGEPPPASAAKLVARYVSHLRRLLDPGPGRGEGGRVLSRPPGYLLRLEPGELDRDRFEALVGEARRRAEPESALALLREALGMWRGSPLQEFASGELARAEIRRLDELHLAVTGERIELELRLGRHAELIGELGALVATHPLREDLCGQLMRALHLCGRSAEALQVFRELRRRLAAGLGAEPQPELRALEQAILAREEAHRPGSGLSRLQPGAASDVRKTVTVLFTDLVDSSHLSLALDPEALRNLLARYFGEQSAIVRRHGGSVEKYIGDAIMAVFGVPSLHEDDALRAVRAAVEMRDALVSLNRELEAGWGVRLANRIGVNTGEVIAGDHTLGHLFVTGEAVNVAKRLEEAAAANEILIGEATHRLVRDAVAAAPSGPRALKHGQTIHALSVTGVLANAPGRVRRADSSFVGRRPERAVLDTLFGGVVRDRACHMLSVLGGAGMGKSRLVQEFVSELAVDVTVLHGRCLPYGEGITYWPLAEIVREIMRGEGLDPGHQSAATIRALLEGDEKAELIAERVAQALGLGGAGGRTSEETFWAVRRLFEARARAGPLVVVMDDLHWAEATFLDLIEHVADHSHDCPILLVCIARPEVLDARPGWGDGRLNATLIPLEPLSDGECHELVANLLDNAPLAAAAEARITGAAEGNPLFAEELVAMLIDDRLLTREGTGWVAASDLSELPVPSTIHALLAARLEGLPAAERVILTTAAVEGAVFHRGLLGELARLPLAALEEGLAALVRRDLVRPDSATFAGESAFRFRHVLIRDAAYRSLPKNARAELHEGFAAWAERTAGERLSEFEEIVGYHLEQAFQYRVALGSRDARADGLAARASDRLEAAGRRALMRTDLPAAIGLLERVSRLLPTADPRRTALLADLSSALIESGRLDEAGHVLDEGERLAAATADERAASHVLVQRQFLRLLRGEEGGLEAAAQVTAQVIPVFARRRDHLGLCHARRLEAWLFWNKGRAAAAATAWERAAAHARRAGDRHEYDEILRWIASSLWFGPTPAAEGIPRCEAMREEVRESPESEAAILRQLACFNAIVGRFAVARELLATSNAAYADLGLTLYVASSDHEAVVELLAGNPAAAEKSARAAYRALEEMGERSFRSTMASSLAWAILEQGRDAEAEEFAEISARLAASGDLTTQIRWRRVRARVLARRGEVREAEPLAREAVEIAEATDLVNDRADALIDLSHVLEASRRCDWAVAAASGALDLYEMKGNVVCAAATRLRLGKLLKM